MTPATRRVPEPRRISVLWREAWTFWGPVEGLRLAMEMPVPLWVTAIDCTSTLGLSRVADGHGTDLGVHQGGVFARMDVPEVSLYSGERMRGRRWDDSPAPSKRSAPRERA